MKHINLFSKKMSGKRWMVLLLTLSTIFITAQAWGTGIGVKVDDSLHHDSTKQVALHQDVNDSTVQIKLDVQKQDSLTTQKTKSSDKYWLRSALDDTKNYKKDFILLLLLACWMIVLLVWGFVALWNQFIVKEEVSTEKIRYCFAFMTVALLCVYSDSSWCYLLLVALILLYMSKNQIGLLDEVSDTIAALQGKKIQTIPAPEKLVEDKRKQEAEENNKENNEQEQPETPEEEGEAPRKRRGLGIYTPANKPIKPKVQMMSLSDFMQTSIDAEHLALQHMHHRYPSLEEQRMWMTNTGKIIFDGFAQEEDKNTIIEVSFTRRMNRIENVHSFDKLFEAQKQITYKTRKQTYLLIVFVTIEEEMKESMKTYYQSQAERYDGLKVEVYTIDELIKLNR